MRLFFFAMYLFLLFLLCPIKGSDVPLRNQHLLRLAFCLTVFRVCLLLRGKHVCIFGAQSLYLWNLLYA